MQRPIPTSANSKFILCDICCRLSLLVRSGYYYYLTRVTGQIFWREFRNNIICHVLQAVPTRVSSKQYFVTSAALYSQQTTLVLLTRSVGYTLQREFRINKMRQMLQASHTRVNSTLLNDTRQSLPLQERVPYSYYVRHSKGYSKKHDCNVSVADVCYIPSSQD